MEGDSKEKAQAATITNVLITWVCLITEETLWGGGGCAFMQFSRY